MDKKFLEAYCLGAFAMLLCVITSLIIHNGIYTWGNVISSFIGFTLGALICWYFL